MTSLTRIRSQSRNLRGLSPRALCRLQLELLRSEVHLTQSKMLFAARKFELALAPRTTLIRLYELLKNSRSTGEQSRRQQLSSLATCAFTQPSRLGVDLRVNPHCTQAGNNIWWRMTGSNRRPPACKAGALPAELIPQNFAFRRWWVWLVSNQRPPPYQDGALTN